ncbi:MAG: tetratricopeptide repeat protein, partial [Candidatus Hodarchaeota archaeon]
MRVRPNSRNKCIAYLNEESKCLRCLGHYREAIAQAQEALVLAKKSPPDLQRQGDALGNLGCIYRQRGELDRAEKSLMRSFTIGEELDNPQQIASSLINLGELYQQRRELNRAENCCKQILSMKERMNTPHYVANCSNNLGEVYWRRGKSNQAKDYYKQSLALREEIGNLQEIAESRYQLIR